jgi:hypothetical protein
VECRKCGKYQITGTALAMLPSRLSPSDKKTTARLSHATKLTSMTTDAEWPEVNSINLDLMLKHPLPHIDRQMTNLVVWAAAQVGDDQLGTVELPDEEDLTAVIGTIDGSRVDALISRAQGEGLIEFVPDHCIRITAKGWGRLPAPAALIPPKEESATIPPTSDAMLIDRAIKAHCNKCRGITNSWVRAKHTVKGTDAQALPEPVHWSNSYEVLQCCGCDTLSVRHEHWFSEWDELEHDETGQLRMRPGIKETYYPSPTVRTKPTWSDSIGDEVLRDVLDELYSALNVGLSVLASVGARTLLDRAGYLLIGDPKGGFEGKLSALVTGGFISAQEKESLDAVADAGNASAHRGYTPTTERLGHIVDIIENFLHRAFVLKTAAEEIRKSTPLRK